MTKRPLIPAAAGELEKFKMEVAKDMALDNIERKNEYMGNIPSAVVSKIKNSGNVGGEMVKRMVESFEKDIAKEDK